MMCVNQQDSGLDQESVLDPAKVTLLPLKGCEDTLGDCTLSTLGGGGIWRSTLWLHCIAFGLADPDAVPQWDKVGVGTSRIRNAPMDPHMALSENGDPQTAIFIGTMILHQWYMCFPRFGIFIIIPFHMSTFCSMFFFRSKLLLGIKDYF